MSAHQAERIGRASAPAEAETRRVPTQPTIIPTGLRDPITFGGLDALAAAVAGALGDRRLELVRGMAGYPGFDTFPIFTVHGCPRTGPTLPLGDASYICAVAVQSTPAETLHAMIEAVQARGPAAKLGRPRRVGSGGPEGPTTAPQASSRAA